MKKYIFILFTFITFKVFCQNNFPESNAIWNVNYVSSNGTPTHEMLYGLKGDTLINDSLYNKLYTLSDTTLSNENLKDYIGGFRQSGQKVWFKPAYWTSTNILLYDFSASAGDTVWHNASAYYDYLGGVTFDHGDMYSVIQEIKMENGLQIYSITGKGGLSDKWYAGIGSNFGLFGSIIMFPLMGDTYIMACFKNNEIVNYQNNPMCGKCFCSGGVDGINEKNSNPDWVRVFPNPARSAMTIKVDKPYLKIMVEIMCENGSILYKSEDLENPISFNNSIHGIYLVRLLIDNEVVIKKLIIE